jgi:biotin transport system substrate-specific component
MVNFTDDSMVKMQSHAAKASKARTLVFSAVFSAMMAVGGLIAIPFFPVPLTLQTFFVYLSVLYLKKWAFLSQLIYIGLGLIGLPVFGGGASGYSVLIGPAGGFLVGFIAGTLVSGNLLQKTAGMHYATAAAILLCAAVIFMAGWLWLAYWLQGNLTGALLVGVLPFLPGDAAKMALSLIIGKKIKF